MPASMRENNVLEPTPNDDIGDEVVVVARTASQALREVHERLGVRANVVEATKVRRGGVGGFFAREMVEIRARGTATEPRDTPGADTGGPTALQRLLADLGQETDRQERSFAETLQSELTKPEFMLEVPAVVTGPDVGEAGTTDALDPSISAAALDAPLGADAPGTIAVPRAPMPAGPVPDAAPSAAVAVPGSPEWSVVNLKRLGLPSAITSQLEDLDPAADLAWLQRLAGLLEPVCGPLPEGASVLAGPRASRLGGSLGFTAVRMSEGAPRAGSFAVRTSGSGRARTWIDAQRDGRWLHLVTGGAWSWSLTFAEPRVVSWVGAEALPDAVRLAVELDLVLGYGLGDGARSLPRRATAVDVAVLLRDLLPRR